MRTQFDCTAGIVPITHVDKELDDLSAGFEVQNLNGVAQGAYKLYDAEAMHGLPVGVQVVGRRLGGKSLGSHEKTGGCAWRR